MLALANSTNFSGICVRVCRLRRDVRLEFRRCKRQRVGGSIQKTDRRRKKGDADVAERKTRAKHTSARSHMYTHRRRHTLLPVRRNIQNVHIDTPTHTLTLAHKHLHARKRALILSKVTSTRQTYTDKSYSYTLTHTCMHIHTQTCHKIQMHVLTHSAHRQHARPPPGGKRADSIALATSTCRRPPISIPLHSPDSDPPVMLVPCPGRRMRSRLQ